MSKTNQTLQTIINYRIKADMALSEVKDGVYTQQEYEEALERIGDQALKEISELLLECKPEKRNLYEAPNGSVESALIGYNSGIDDYEKNIKAIL